jgi:hypothetical protein
MCCDARALPGLCCETETAVDDTTAAVESLTIRGPRSKRGRESAARHGEPTQLSERLPERRIMPVLHAPPNSRAPDTPGVVISSGEGRLPPPRPAPTQEGMISPTDFLQGASCWGVTFFPGKICRTDLNGQELDSEGSISTISYRSVLLTSTKVLSMSVPPALVCVRGSVRAWGRMMFTRAFRGGAASCG